LHAFAQFAERFTLDLPHALTGQAQSLAEPFVKPSTMLYRNFLAMECEELLRSHRSPAPC